MKKNEQVAKVEELFNCKVINQIGNVFIVFKFDRVLDDDSITTSNYIGEVTFKDGLYNYRCLDAHVYLTNLDNYEVSNLY